MIYPPDIPAEKIQPRADGLRYKLFHPAMAYCAPCGPSCAVPSCASSPVVGFGSDGSGYGRVLGYGPGETSRSLGTLAGITPSCINQIPASEVTILPPPVVLTIPGPILSASCEPLAVGGNTPCAVSGSGPRGSWGYGDLGFRGYGGLLGRKYPWNRRGSLCLSPRGNICL